jgi:GrpB-like predicted nucleotidyltransferase (UPF0157 family)
MTRERIVIVPYRPSWPREFERESARVRQALGELAVAAEHVGSTAIPGMASKPIIDVMIGVRSLTLARAKVGAVEALGYAYVPEFEAQIPERLFFQRGNPRTHHLHVVEPGSAFWERQLVFRDYLRGHADTAKAYQELKEALAVAFADDREGYTKGKTVFVEAVLAKASASRRS